MNNQELIAVAKKYLEHAYADYSKFKVGAALLTKDESIYGGANIENASYGLSMCAERVAIFKAISEGVKKEDIIALAIISNTDGPIKPCGACRQVMNEFFTPDVRIILADTNGNYIVTNIDELMPLSFNKEVLNK